MNFVDLIPLIIFGLIYFYGSQQKKRREAEDAKQKATPAPDSSEPQAESSSLRSKLDDAITQMYNELRDEPDPIESRSQRGSSPGTPASDTDAGPQIAARTRMDREHEKPADIDTMVARTMYDRDIVESSSEKPPESPEAASDSYTFRSQFKDIAETDYRESSFGGFSQAHGIHYDERGQIHYADDKAFKEFSGIYLGGKHPRAKMPPARKRSKKVEVVFEDQDDLKRAVVLAEVLGPPMALRGGRRRVV